MIIKLAKNESWFKVPKRHNPDIDILAWQYGQKEFSVVNDESFDRHIHRLEDLNRRPYFKNFNGTRVKEILKNEPYWYMIFMVIGTSFLL